MRRILEHYFMTLGGYSFDTLIEKFDENDQIVCGSLISWVHDGSHSAEDALYVCTDDSCIATYLRVFKLIFVNSNHINHFTMMCPENLQERIDAIIDSDAPEGADTVVASEVDESVTAPAVN